MIPGNLVRAKHAHVSSFYVLNYIKIVTQCRFESAVLSNQFYIELLNFKRFSILLLKRTYP